MDVKTKALPDNTRYVTMVSPRGTRVKITVSKRHFGVHAIDYYRSKGFKTLEDLSHERQLAELQAENERLRAEAEAKAAAEKTAAAEAKKAEKQAQAAAAKK